MTTDWNPETYARFRGFRLRPALDLLAQVGAVPDGPVIDLGCGDGAVGPDLALRFAGHRLIGVDASAAMLAQAAKTGLYSALHQADIGLWGPVSPPALVFSNAALHWLPDHAALFPRLAGWLAPGGTLAVQMPAQHDAPSHTLLRDIAARMFPGRFAPAAAPVHPMQTYHEWLARIGDVTLWDTTYLQRQAPAITGHPIRAFTESTAMRPFLRELSPEETTAYVAAYDAGLHDAYPLQPDGSALFPFRRRFLILKV